MKSTFVGMLMLRARTEAIEPALRREAVGNGFRVREISYPPGLRQEPHAHDFAGITLVLEGGIRETVAGREEVAQILSVVVKPAGVVHADEIGPRGARTVQVILDGDRYDGLGPWRWLHAGLAIRPLLALQRFLHFGSPDAEGLDARVLEVLGELVEDDSPDRGDPPAWLREAREALDDTLPEGLPVKNLAAISGVHPVPLTRAFRRHYGVSVCGYRRRERVRWAARAIERSNCHLTRIAHATGFSDHPHMCREMRAATGLTPTELRELARSA